MGASPHTNDDRHAQSAPLMAGQAADDALYVAALASLLDQAARPPGLLDRIGRALRAFHARRRHDAELVPLEYRFWTM
jgi:hypothetical protein